jgi:Mn2+/Fe2+ NRAMP family transporter
VLAGLSGFLVTAGFQFGNNMGVALAIGGIVPAPMWIWPILFTALSLVFMFAARRLYAVLERLMKVLVGIMIIAFFANLFWTGVGVRGVLGGFVPRWEPADALVARGMLATTFSVVAAFYQAYLVQAKGWARGQVKDAILDAWLGIAILGLISAAILSGAAETLYGAGESFDNVGQLAQILRGILGPAANWIFCLGLTAAAFSSFIVNALVGGALFADGLGMDARVNGMPAKSLAAGVMVIGCVVSLGVIFLEAGATTSVLIAQASTLVAAPLCAVLLVFLSSSRELMGDLRNNAAYMALGGVGLVVVVMLWVVTLVKLVN